jgi:phosphoribosyl-AMP cyclohydrolase
MIEHVIDNVAFNSDGLVPAIVQSSQSGRVLMLAWMNAEALAMTIESGETVFWSRSRRELWHKGETSGHVQKVVSIEMDCDSDALLIRVEVAGSACHNGTESCFDTTLLLNRDS